MSIRELLEEGDTGEALLPAKVNDQGVHADRDGSEPRGLVDVVRSLSADHEAPLPAPPVHIVHNHDLDPTCRETRNQHDRLVGECLKAPRGDNPLHGSARTRGAEESIPAVPDREHIVTVPRERVEAFREWLSRPSGSFSAGPRLTFEAVEGGTFWVRTRPWRLKP